MSSVVISGDSSGTVTLTVPSAAGTNTATLPAATGTVMVSGNQPSFSAYIASNFTLTNNAYTKVGFNTKDWDTNNCYDNVTNYRFTPTVAGYYQFNINASFNTPQSTEVVVALYKNGSANRYVQDLKMTNLYIVSGSIMAYANGSTDYFEVYVYQVSGGSTLLLGGANQSCFQASLIRTA